MSGPARRPATLESRFTRFLEGLRSEPRGGVTAAELKRRPSRRTTLDELIGNFTFLGSPEQQTRLRTLLEEAATRLGKPASDAHLGNPEFMVQYALNLTDVANWQDIEVTLKGGSTATARKYVSPAAEQSHLQALRDAATDRSSDFAMQSALSLAVDDPARLLPEGRSAAVAWARRSPTAAAAEVSSDDAGEQRMRKEAVLTAAMVAMRDADDALRAEHGEWARAQLDEALKALDDDPARQIRGGLRFNPTAIAYAGLIHALRHRHTPDDMRALLETAATGNHAAAHGFGAAVVALEAVDSRLPRAILRCAFSACVVENRIWDAPQDEVDARMARSLARAGHAVTGEMAWLYGVCAEPQWPRFPEEPARPRRRLRLPGARMAARRPPEAPTPSPTEHANHQAAALWLRHVRSLPDESARPWLSEIVKAYMPWTTAANGTELHDGDETDHPPSEWNDTFFAAAARCVIGLSTDEATELVVKHVVKLSDRNFYDVLADFLRSFDAVYFEGGILDAAHKVGVYASPTAHASIMFPHSWRMCRRCSAYSALL